MYKDNILKLIPQNKFDVSTIDKLSELNSQDITKILPDLFSWIADINWPVAMPIIDVLAKHSDVLVPYLKEYLAKDALDDELKYFIIAYLLPVLTKEIQQEVWMDVKRICSSPTEIEKYGSFEAALGYCQKKC